MIQTQMIPLLVCLLAIAPGNAAEKPVPVFILAGQSNMEGKAPNSLLDHQATDAKTSQAFAHLRKDDQWIVRDDVFIKFLDRHGPLTQKDYGSSYRKMMAEVKEVMENHAALFPTLKGRKLALAGFVWFQGWNDQYGAENEYTSNLKHFIQDVRQDLHAPQLPLVIAAMGQNGSKPATGAMRIVQQAQLSMNDVPEFKGNVKAIRTDILVDTEAEALYPAWQKNLEQWKLTGGDHPYHYLGSAIWFNRIGRAMGEAMSELLGAP